MTTSNSDLCVIFFLGAEIRQGFELPAGPPKISKSLRENTFHQNLVHFENLSLGHSRAAEFSWTSRSQNLKLHAKILRSEASQQNP